MNISQFFSSDKTDQMTMAVKSWTKRYNLTYQQHTLPDLDGAAMRLWFFFDPDDIPFPTSEGIPDYEFCSCFWESMTDFERDLASDYLEEEQRLWEQGQFEVFPWGRVQ